MQIGLLYTAVLDYVSAICLPFPAILPSSAPPLGTVAEVAGWGATDMLARRSSVPSQPHHSTLPQVL